jgi:hypothetical protein
MSATYGKCWLICSGDPRRRQRRRSLGGRRPPGS